MQDMFAFWGCGRGPLKYLHVHIRIISGTLLCSTCLMIPPHSISGNSLMFIAATVWCILAGMPAKMLIRCAIGAFILFFPVFLITPWMMIDPSTTTPMADRFLQTGAITLRSTCSLFIAASTIAILPIQDMHRGLAHLPIPRPFVVMIIQLINQTVLLTDETMRIIAVLRLRGTSGVRGGRVMFSFPVVWMVRMLFRAERTAAAMMVRGYGVEAVVADESITLTIADGLAILGACAVITVSVLIRLRILP